MDLIRTMSSRDSDAFSHISEDTTLMSAMKQGRAAQTYRGKRSLLGQTVPMARRTTVVVKEGTLFDDTNELTSST